MPIVKNTGWAQPENQNVECLKLILVARSMGVEVMWCVTACVKPKDSTDGKSDKLAHAKEQLCDAVLSRLDAGVFTLPRMSGKRHYLGWCKQKELRSKAEASDLENHYIQSDDIEVWDWEEDRYHTYARIR